MKTKILLLFSAILLSMSLQAQNTITIVNPPQTVNASSFVNITFNYTLDIPAHAFIRFKDASGNLTDVNKILSAGSGTETLSLEIPDVPVGGGYSYQAQLFNHNAGYAFLAQENVNGVTVEAAIPPANSITILNPPTTVQAGTNVDITFDYTTDVANAHLFIRFKDAGNLTDVSQIVTAGSGTLTLSLPIPSTALGTGYSFQAQIFDIDASYANIVSKNYPNVTVTAPPANTVAINNPPMQVIINSTVDITLSYTKDVPEAYVLVRFKDAAGNLEQVFDLVTANAGEITLSLPTPTTAGTEYSYQAQLFSNDFGIVYDTKNYSGITASAPLSTGDFKSKFENLSIYPNPFSDSFTYKFEGRLSDSVNVELFSIDGRIIKTNKNSNTSYANSGTVFTGHLSNGMYLVRITSGDVQETRRLIKN